MTLVKKIKLFFGRAPKKISPRITPLDNFLNDPEACIFDDQGQQYNWEAVPTLHPSVYSLKDIRLISAGKTIGYVQLITMNSDLKSACIGHFATHEDYTGMNVGRTMSITLKNLFHLHHGVNVIVFRENSYTNPKANYGSFFSSLGATAHREQRLVNLTWVWNFGSSQTPVANILGSLPY
jgi:hypothetical protein